MLKSFRNREDKIPLHIFKVNYRPLCVEDGIYDRSARSTQWNTRSLEILKSNDAKNDKMRDQLLLLRNNETPMNLFFRITPDIICKIRRVSHQGIKDTPRLIEDFQDLQNFRLNLKLKQSRILIPLSVFSWSAMSFQEDATSKSNSLKNTQHLFCRNASSAI